MQHREDKTARPLRAAERCMHWKWGIRGWASAEGHLEQEAGRGHCCLACNDSQVHRVGSAPSSYRMLVLPAVSSTAMSVCHRPHSGQHLRCSLAHPPPLNLTTPSPRTGLHCDAQSWGHASNILEGITGSIREGQVEQTCGCHAIFSAGSCLQGSSAEQELQRTMLFDVTCITVAAVRQLAFHLSFGAWGHLAGHRIVKATPSRRLS